MSNTGSPAIVNASRSLSGVNGQALAVIMKLPDGTVACVNFPGAGKDQVRAALAGEAARLEPGKVCVISSYGGGS